MASGKQSPRQKMINMMYLVLTAMLALNVSAEILNAFDTIRRNLVDSAAGAEGQAQSTADYIKVKIDEEVKQGKPLHEPIKDSLDIIRQRTKDIIAFIDKTDKDLLDGIPGIYDKKTDQILKKDESELNHQFFMGHGQDDANGGRGAGRAKALRDTLSGYYKWLIDIYKVNRPDSIMSKMSPIFTITDPDPSRTEGVKKTWERFNFEGPIVANRAILEALKQDVYQREDYLLNSYAARLGIVDEKKPDQKVLPPPPPKEPDPIKEEPAVGEPFLILSPVSSVVPAGFPYEAKIYIGLKQGSDVSGQFTASTGTISAVDGGQGASLKILPNIANLGPKGETEQSFTVNANVKTAKGSKPVSITGKFMVRKPEIVVTSASIQNLYRNCGNMINIDVPALGELYNPVCTATDAEIKQSGDSKKKFLIVPRGNKCVVGVSSMVNGVTMKIGDVNYNVIEPPKPSIELKINGQRATAQTAVGRGSQVEIVVLPDNEFKGLLPMDAKYEVTRVDAFVQCGLTPPRNVGGADLSGRDAMSGLKFPVPGDAFQCQSGSKLFFEVKDVVRKNFQGKRFPDDRFTLYEKAITVMTK